MFISICWVVATSVLIVITSELASDVSESNLTYTKSKWLGAYSSAGDSSAPTPSKDSEMSPNRE